MSTDTLVGYWKFDETAADSCSGGEDACDSAGGGYHGTHASGTTISSAVPTLTYTNARSLDFDATDDRVVVAHNAAFNNLNNITIAVWVYKDAAGTDDCTIVSKRSAWSSTGIPFELRSRRDNISFLVIGGEADFADFETTENSLPLGEWVHVAATWDGSNIRLYQNGTLVKTVARTGTVTNNTTDVTIGTLPDGTSEEWDGMLDDLRIYSRALSGREIAEMAAGNHPAQYWKGATGTSYEYASNWSGSYLPDPYTRVVIPWVGSQPVTMTGTVQLAGLTIGTGAALKTNTKNLTMNDSGTFTNYGTLRIHGSETFTNLTNDTSKGTVLVYGTGSYTGLPTGTSYYHLNLNDGLAGYWKLDETTGTRAVDSSGYGNSGSLVNGPTISTTVASTNFANARSLSFDGTNDYVSLGNIQAGAMAFTWSAWIKTTVSINEGNFYQMPVIIGTVQGDGDTNDAILGVNNGELAWFDELDSANTFDSNVAVNDNAWHHVAVTRNGTSLAFYIDGTRVGTDTTGTDGLNSLGMEIAKANWTNNNFFSGNIDDVRVYSRALLPGELAALAAGNQPSLQRATVTLNGALDVNGDLTLNGGTLDVSSGNYSVTMGGSFLNHGGVLNARRGTVTFDGTSSSLKILSGGQRFNAVTLNGSSATWTLRDRLSASGALTLSNGTLDVDSTGNYSVRAGTMTQTSGTLTARSGILALTSPANQTATITSTLNTLHVEDPTENGLVGYWKFDEGTNSGAILDSSGYGNIGVRRGSGALVWAGSTLPTLTFDDPFAMKFNGGNDYVDAGNASILQQTGDMTTSWWQRIDVAPPSNGNLGTVVSFGANGETQATNYLYANGVKNVSGSMKARAFHESGGGTNNEVTSSTTLSTGVWQHIVVVRDASADTYTFYIDGQAESPQSYSNDSDGGTSGKLRIGDAQSGIREYVNGIIDDLRVYNRTLSSAEIRNLYNGYYADGDNATATFTLGGNLDLSTMTILSGVVGAGSRTLDVSGDWSNYAGTGAFVASTSTVDLDGSSTQNVRGSTNFSTFEISTSASQTVKFGSGTTQGMSTNLVLQGASSNLLTLAPLSAGYTWYLDLGDSATQTIDYVSPSYSNASGGLLLLAHDGTSTDGGNNANWLFVSPEVSFQSGSLTISETAGIATFTITRSGSTLQGITIPYSYGGTATGTGSDYTILTPSPLYMAAGETSTGVILTLIDDSTAESDETIILTLGTPTNGVVGSTGSVTITLTSDEALPSSAASGNSGGGGGGHRGTAGPGGESTSERAKRARLAIAERFNHQLQESSAVVQRKKVPASVAREKIQETTPTASGIGSHIRRIAQQRGRLVAVVEEREVLYRDVVVTEWYAPYVASLIEQNVAQGYRDEQGKPKGEFGVANPVTRAEVLKMALEGAKKKLESRPPRNPSAQGTWAAPYVGEAENMGLTVFPVDVDVNTPATRGEVMQILLEVMGLPVGKTPALFADVPADHPYNKAIATAAFYGIVEGDTDTSGKSSDIFRPDDRINRAEVAKIIALLREILK